MRIAITLLLCLASSLNAQEFSILSWNIESGGSNSDVIDQQLKRFVDPFDILAFSEVDAEELVHLSKHFGAGSFVSGTTGKDNRLAIAWDNAKFERVQFQELKEYQGTQFGNGQRAPLILTLRFRETRQEFLLINNHFASDNEYTRNQQARMLVEWARKQSLPVIAVGDYNMDYIIRTQKGNVSFSILQRDGVFKWIAPEEPIDTNWTDSDKDGKDDHPGSMLDFVFVSGIAQKWNIKTKVIVRSGDFPDDAKTSNHRPVLTKVSFAK